MNEKLEQVLILAKILNPKINFETMHLYWSGCQEKAMFYYTLHPINTSNPIQ